MKDVLFWTVWLTATFFAVLYAALLLGWLKPWVEAAHLIFPTVVAFGVSLAAAMYFKWQ